MTDLSFYKNVFNQSQNAVSIIRHKKNNYGTYNLVIEYVNQAEANIQGETIGRIEGSVLDEIFVGEDSAWIDFFISVILEQRDKSITSFNVRLQKHLSIRAFPISKDEILLLTEDVSKKIDEEVKKRDNLKYHKLFNQVQCGVTEFYVNEKGIYYCDANPASFKILGYSPEEFWEKHMWKTEEIVVSEDVEAAKNIFSCLCSIGDETEYKYRLLKKDGSSIWTFGSLTLTDISERGKRYQNYFIDIDKQTKVELELNDERLMYQSILDETKAAVIVIDCKTYEVLYGNKKALKELEKEPDTYIGSICYRYVLNKDNPCDFCPINKGLSISNNHQFELDGRIFRQEFKHIMWYGREALVEYNYDITEENRLFQLIEANQKNLQRTIESIPGGIVVYEISNNDVSVIQANPAACQMLGWPEEEMITMKNEQIFSRIHYDDLDYVRDKVSGLKIPGTTTSYQYRLYNPKLKKYIWIIASGTAVKYPNSHTIVYIALREITDFIESTKKYENIYSSLPCGIIEYIIKDGMIKYVNANNQMLVMLGYDSDESFVGKWASIDGVFHNDIFNNIKKIYSSIKEVGDVRNFEFKVRRKDNSYIWLRGTLLVESIDEDGFHILSAVNDEDARKKAESESEAKSRFLSRMSHEIRTPINVIMGIAELEKQDIENNIINRDNLINYVTETMDMSKYLLRLVNDILDTSSIENNKMEIHQEIIDFNLYFKELKKVVNQFVKDNFISFTLERNTYYHNLYICDGIRVKQVIMNLLNNAFKFTPPGGNVKLVVEEIPETKEFCMLQFTVSDTGIGIGEEFQKQLFTPFSQEANDNTSPFSGSGLGLSIARELVRLMGGDLICHSKKGVGSTFIATIRVGLVQDEQICKSKPIKDMENFDFKGLHILICEDHPLNQKITKALLERKHCKVDIANDGVSGLDMFVNSPIGYYSLIIMDIRMPNKDGLQTTKEIRKLKRTDAKTIPIIALSANAFEEDIEKSLLVGMNDHLSKPIDAMKLYKSIIKFTHCKLK